MAGIEPATDGLRNRCSTAELHWHPRTYIFRLSSELSPTTDQNFGASLFMDSTNNTAKDNPPEPRFVKTNIPPLKSPLVGLAFRCKARKPARNRGSS
jgi:hypothetical protein